MYGIRMKACAATLVTSLVPGCSSLRAHQSHKKPLAAIYVEAPSRSWTQGYLGWVQRHPAVLLAMQSASSTSGGGSSNAPASHRLDLLTPYLDYFTTDGNSLYLNTVADANIDFLNKLPQSAQARPSGAASGIQPTLAEYLDIFPELKPYKAGILAEKHPVVLAICNNDKPPCQQQNKALGAFKSRAASLKIQVVEVRLLRSNVGQ